MRLKLEYVLWWLLIVLIPAQTAKHFWPSFSLINGLKIDYLSPTVYLTDIIVILLLLVKPPHIFVRGKKTAFISIFILINTLLSLSPLFTAYRWLRIIIYSLLTLRTVQSWKIVNNILPYSLSVAVLWTSFLAIYQFINQSSVGGFWWYLGERPLALSAINVAKYSLGNWGIFMRSYATFPHPNALAGFLLVSFWLLFYYHQTTRKLKYPNLIFGVMLISVLALCLTFSRSVIVLFVMSLPFVFSLRKTYFRVCLVICSALSLILINYLIFSGPPASLSERIYLLEKSYSLVLKYPLVGIGLGNFSLAEYSVRFNNPLIFYQPVHNIFALLAVETGIPAIMVLLYFSLLFIKRCILRSNFIIKIALANIFFLSLIDHYWITSTANILLLTFILSLTIVRSGVGNYEKKP